MFFYTKRNLVTYRETLHFLTTNTVCHISGLLGGCISFVGLAPNSYIDLLRTTFPLILLISSQIIIAFVIDLVKKYFSYQTLIWRVAFFFIVLFITADVETVSCFLGQNIYVFLILAVVVKPQVQIRFLIRIFHKTIFFPDVYNYQILRFTLFLFISWNYVFSICYIF